MTKTLTRSEHPIHGLIYNRSYNHDCFDCFRAELERASTDGRTETTCSASDKLRALYPTYLSKAVQLITGQSDAWLEIAQYCGYVDLLLTTLPQASSAPKAELLFPR